MAIYKIGNKLCSNGNGKLFSVYEEPPVEGLVIDGKTYRTVTIGNREWMAENLEADSFGGTWYNNNISYKDKHYGKLYTWDEIKDISTVVPEWEIPTSDDWEALIEAVGGRDKAGSDAIASTEGWQDEYGSHNGTDEFGFSMYPNGCFNGSYFDGGQGANLWSCSLNPRFPDYRMFAYNYKTAHEDNLYLDSVSINSKNVRYAVRLIKTI